MERHRYWFEMLRASIRKYCAGVRSSSMINSTTSIPGRVAGVMLSWNSFSGISIQRSPSARSMERVGFSSNRFPGPKRCSRLIVRDLAPAICVS